MESKIKTLKVAELRELLQKASVSIPAKANKADLVAKVLASPAALETYNKQNAPEKVESTPQQSKVSEVSAAPDDDLLAPPEQFDWEPEAGAGSLVVPALPETKSEPTKPPSAVSKPAASAEQPAAPTEQPSKPVATTKATTAEEDAEMERRRKRAARFGIPFVEPKAKPEPKAASKPGNGVKAAKNGKPALTPEAQARLDARAARFGVPKAASATAAAAPATTTTTVAANTTAISPAANVQKRKEAPAVDAEELERRKKRAERFGAPSGETKAA